MVLSCHCGVRFLEKEESAVSTIVVRGSTDNIMDDIERSVDDGINTFRTIIKVSTVYSKNLYTVELWAKDI